MDEDAELVERLRRELADAREMILDYEYAIEEWKNASGLIIGGDPDGVRPHHLEDYWGQLELELKEADRNIERIRTNSKRLFRIRNRAINFIEERRCRDWKADEVETLHDLLLYYNGVD